MAFNKYKASTAVLVTCEIRDKDGTLLSPDTSTKITVVDPDGTVKVDDQNMTEDSTGNFSYIVQTADTWTAGHYKTIITSVHSGTTVATQDHVAFKLEA